MGARLNSAAAEGNHQRPPLPMPMPLTISPDAAAAAPVMPGLAACGLACRRGRRLLFRGLDLQLASGTVTWLRGANGSGKTSLMRILAGLTQPAEGAVSWDGMPLRRSGADAQRKLLYIGHANALKDDLSLSESLAFLARLAGLDQADARARAALSQVGLTSRTDAAVRTLSQGQRRRGALARLVLDDAPRVWILDEPYDALDTASVAWLTGVIEAHRQRGGAVLLTSHQAVPLPQAREFDLEPWCVA